MAEEAAAAIAAAAAAAAAVTAPTVAEESASFRVIIVPVLSDNYSYLIVDDATKEALAVDPAEAHIVIARAKQEGVTITGVLCTHHHADHAGGNTDMLREMQKNVPNAAVYGHALDKVLACTHPLQHDQEIKLGENVLIRTLHTPGHTKGSACFFVTTPGKEEEGAVFTGDTLFVGGCGRSFESPPEDLYNSVCNVIGALPPQTQVYVGHEYTVKNLEFAVGIETKNETLAKMLAWSKEQVLSRKFTVPTTMQNEFLINPFLRAGSDELRSMCPGCTPSAIFVELRQQKNEGKANLGRLAALGGSG